MMTIKEIMTGVDAVAIEGAECDVRDVQFDSRRVGEGTLFVAQRGTHVNGHEFIGAAVARGAQAVVCEEMPAERAQGVCYIQVPDSSKALGQLAANLYGNPSKQLRLIGITGTNGKTTTVTLLHQLFRRLGYHVGLLSTIVNKIDEEELPASHTTPDALEANRLLREMVDRGCAYCFMEVSSHALVQHRTEGLHFKGAIFSNITHDHLDFHKTMANYIAAKKSFFDGLGRDAWALVNVDDSNGMVMVQNTKARIVKYAMQREADIKCKIVESTFEGMLLRLDGCEIWSRLVGRFNAYNLMAIYGAAILCGEDKERVLQELSGLEAAPGRFQYVNGRGVTGIVDYAHTPDALQNVIDTVNAIRQRTQQLVVVIGCGGDRDHAKRPIMARIAVEWGDKVVLTSDNPRSENPERILDDMESGLSAEQLCKVVRIANRRQAIKAACKMAREGDIVLVAGKGHEKYQEIDGVKSHFDDVEELQQELGAI